MMDWGIRAAAIVVELNDAPPEKPLEIGKGHNGHKPRPQCKDIDDRTVLAFLAEEDRWATHWWLEDGTTGLRSIPRAFPQPAFPEKVFHAKMGKLLRRGLVTGCACGCRGDWGISGKGLRYLALLGGGT